MRREDFSVVLPNSGTDSIYHVSDVIHHMSGEIHTTLQVC